MMRNGDQEVGYECAFECEDEDGKTMKIDEGKNEQDDDDDYKHAVQNMIATW